MSEEAQCSCRIHPGSRAAARLPKIPIATPDAQTKLNPRARLFSDVTEAITGARATGHAEKTSPASAARTNNAGPEVATARNADSPATRVNETISVLRMPNRWIANTDRIDPAILAAVMNPDINPRKFSRKPSFSRY